MPACLFRITFFIFLISIFFPRQSFSLAKFNTEYKISYQILEDGNTKVFYDVSQTNNISTVFATDYSLSLNQTRLNNLVIKDEGVPISYQLTQSDNQSSIQFTFQNKVVGKEKTHHFSIEYDSPDIVSKQKNIWHINVPHLNPDENITSQEISIDLPPNAPDVSYVDPKPSLQTKSRIYFDQKNLGNKSISIILGDSQTYQADLIYNLENPLDTQANIDIALPPDTEYQSVVIQKIDPAPSNTFLDDDGNLLARITLNPHQYQTINVSAIIKVNLSPAKQITSPQSKQQSTSQIWDFNQSIFDQPNIQSLKTPRQIFDFVVDTLSYDYLQATSSAVRRPSSESLKTQRGTCLDYSNLFVSIARKKGFYAREIEGIALSTSPVLQPISLEKDVLHSWAEYYDSKQNTWIQVDPTWTDTSHGIDYFSKLDLSHITLAIHGLNPTMPLPPGAYRTSKTNMAKLVSVIAIDSITIPQKPITISSLDIKDNNIILSLENPSGSIKKIHFQSDSSQFLEASDSYPQLTPFSKTQVKIPFKNKYPNQESPTSLIIYLDGERKSLEFTPPTKSNNNLLYAKGAVFLGFVTFVAGYLYLRRRKPHPPLHR